MTIDSSIIDLGDDLVMIEIESVQDNCLTCIVLVFFIRFAQI